MLTRLKLARMEKGFTQKELAQRLGIPPWKISRWENGRLKLDSENALLVQKVLDLNLPVFDPPDSKVVGE